MRERWKILLLGQLLWLAFAPSTVAQTRAALSQPVIRRSGDDVLLVCRITDLNPSYEYRFGFGTADAPLDVKLELTRDGRAMPQERMTFEQGHSSGWWKVDSIQAYGVEFTGGSEISVTARVNREHARQFERVFLFISRKYAADTWYLEDGVELNRSHW